MAFKTIMSPAVTAHYPLRIKELYVSPGEMVQPETKALLAETADGRKIAIKCGHEGRVLQVPQKNTVLDSRQMLLVIETFDAASPHPDGQGDDEASRREAEQAAETERAADEAHQAAYARASGQKETIRSTSDEPVPQEEPKQAAPETAAKSSATSRPSHTASPEQDGTSTPSGKKVALIAASFLAVLIGGAVAMQLLDDSPSLPSRGSGSMASSSSVPKASSPKPTPVAKAPAPLPKRPYPSDQDRDWTKVPNIKAKSFISYNDDEGNGRNVEFFSLDADSNQAHFVGKAGRETIMTSFRFDKKTSFRNMRTIGVNPEKAFIFANFPKDEVATVFISPQGEKPTARAYQYPERKGKPQRVEGFKATGRLIHADRDGGLFALLLQNNESFREQVLVFNDKGKSNSIHLPDVHNDILLSELHTYNHVTLDSQSKDGLTQATAMVTGGASSVFVPDDGYSLGFRVQANSSSVKLQGGNGLKLDVTKALPKGVFSKFGSLEDKKSMNFGGFMLTASAMNGFGQTAVMGGFVHGMGSQWNKDGTYRADAYLTWRLGNGKDMTRMLVRNDSNWRNGVVVKDLEFFENGQLAVLLREYSGEPYSALLFLDKNGKVRSRYAYSNVIMHDIDSYRGKLYAAGYTTKEGKHIGAAWEF